MRLETFNEKLYESDKHIQKIKIAKKNLQNIIPLSLESYNIIDDIQASFIDQMIFRFTKLQDTIGEKIFPGILELLGEDIKSKSFIDRLNRLEELELVNKNQWLRLRKDRNEIAHEYSFNQEEVIDSINLIYDLSEEIFAIYHKIKKYINLQISKQEVV